MHPRRHPTTPLAECLEAIFHRMAGAAFRRWPRPTPSKGLLANCRIVSHRGEHDNRNRLENTLEAFQAAVDAGVWGLEMDIRWTSDLVPVVFHDPDTRRLFDADIRIADISLDQVKRRFPAIPALSEVVAHFGGQAHLMIEIKAGPFPDPSRQARRLEQVLGHLEPGEEYHLMALHPDLFAPFGFLPPETFLPIARVRMDRFSRMAASKGWGGVTGHYLLAGNHVIQRHQHLGQGVGTGFVDSRYCLYREAARGVDWIFSNRAAAMQAICTRIA